MIAADERHGEFPEQPPDDVAHEQEWNQHGDKRDRQRYDGEADFARALERRVERRTAVFEIARDVFDHDDGVVDDEACRNGQRHQCEIVEAVAAKIHDRERADERQRHGDAGHERGPQTAEKQIDHRDDEQHGEEQFELNVLDRGANGRRAVGEHVDVDRAGKRRPQRRQKRLDLVDDGDDIRARLSLHIDDDRRLPVAPGAEIPVFRADRHARDVAQPHRAGAAIGDDEILIVAGAFELIVGVDGEFLRRAVDRALGQIDVCARNRRAQIFERHAVRGERADIRPHDDGRPVAAADADEADAGKLRDFLGDARVRELLHLRERQRRRGERKRQDGRIGRVDLRIDGRRRKVGGQKIHCGVDGGLHLLFGDVERQREAELQGDDRGAARTRRGDLRQSRHLPQLPLQRRGDGGGHHLGAGPGIEGAHFDRREINLRQRRDRQQPIGDGAGEEHRSHQERGRDRPQNERPGNVEGAHEAFCLPGGPPRPPPFSRSPPMRHGGAIPQAVCAFGHHLLAGAQAVFDHDPLAARGAKLHGPGLDGFLRRHSVDEWPFRALLHGGDGRERDVAQGLDQEIGVDKLVGEQPLVVIGEFGAQLDRAGRRVDLIVHGDQMTAREFMRAVVIIGDDRRLFAGAEFLQHVGQPALGDREDDRDRRQPCDDGDAIGVARLHIIALIDMPQSEASLDRRDDPAIGRGSGAPDRRARGRWRPCPYIG